MPDPTPPRRVMRLTNVRLPEPVHAQVQGLSKGLGISSAQYVREAVLLRIAMDTLTMVWTEAAAAQGYSSDQIGGVRQLIRDLLFRMGEEATKDADEILRDARSTYTRDNQPGTG